MRHNWLQWNPAPNNPEWEVVASVIARDVLAEGCLLQPRGGPDLTGFGHEPKPAAPFGVLMNCEASG